MIDERERVILVTETDTEIGDAPKLEAHRTGALHRAFSVFLLDCDGRVLLQRRATGKYHSPGLRSNTCCGHPRPGERTNDAARRRLREEMGIDCELSHASSFVYRADLEGELVEHELDHVFVGLTSDLPLHDSAEVSECRWIEVDELREWLRREPMAFTAWFALAFEEAAKHDAFSAA